MHAIANMRRLRGGEFKPRTCRSGTAPHEQLKGAGVEEGLQLRTAYSPCCIPLSSSPPEAHLQRGHGLVQISHAGVRVGGGAYDEEKEQQERGKRAVICTSHFVTNTKC